MQEARFKSKMLFRSETIFVNFLYLLVFICEMFINHVLKCQFLVLSADVNKSVDECVWKRDSSYLTENSYSIPQHILMLRITIKISTLLHFKIQIRINFENHNFLICLVKLNLNQKLRPSQNNSISNYYNQK